MLRSMRRPSGLVGVDVAVGPVSGCGSVRGCYGASGKGRWPSGGVIDGAMDERGRVQAGDLLGQPEAGEVEIAGHLARRSRISRSQSSSRRFRSLKSLSSRTRSMASANESMMSWLRLVPWTQARRPGRPVEFEAFVSSDLPAPGTS